MELDRWGRDNVQRIHNADVHAQYEKMKETFPQLELYETQMNLPFKEQVIQNAKKLLEELYKEYGVPLHRHGRQEEQQQTRERSRGF